MAQEIADSTLLDTWSSSGLIVKPDISKIIEGWQLGEQPPHEYMNWLQNTFGSKLNHILKNGVASWNNETEYLAGATTQHNGSIWICKTTNTNSEPTELNNNWEKMPSLENLALTVDTINDFPSSATTGDVIIVKDLDRGGMFIYDSTKVAEDNQGTNFNGWVRQYSGAVNAKWFATTKHYSDFAKNFIPEGAIKFNYYPNGDFSTDTYTIIDGITESKHYHGVTMCVGYDGKIHMVYRVGTAHYAVGGWSLGYRNSSDGGATWTEEQLIKTGSASSIFSPTSISMTPNGKLIIVYTELPMDGIVPKSPTYFKTVASVDNGLSWFDDSTLATINDTYARTYGRAKIIPTNNKYGYNIGVTAYYRYAPGLYKVAIYYSDDNGATWTEGTPITMGVDNVNETEFLPITSTYWIAISRVEIPGNTKAAYFETRDGGATWTRLGYYPSSFSSNTPVSPTLDKFYKNGKIYVLLGMFARSKDSIEWVIASAYDLSSNPNAWTGSITTNPDYQNASGYQAPIANMYGFIDVDSRFSYAIIRENYDNPYSLINFSSIDLQKEAVRHPAIYSITSGAINILENEFEKVIRIDTESEASLDDLVTINGGYEGQTIIVENVQTTNSRDVNIKSGIGNLILNGDYRLIDSNSRIVLKKTGNSWYELARGHDTPYHYATISNGVATIPNSSIPRFVYIDTENGAETDDLTSLNGGINGQIITLSLATSSRKVTIRDGENINIIGDFTMLSGNYTITLIYGSGLWREISRIPNA